jgi:hypothetical protein
MATKQTTTIPPMATKQTTTIPPMATKQTTTSHLKSLIQKKPQHVCLNGGESYSN